MATLDTIPKGSGFSPVRLKGKDVTINSQTITVLARDGSSSANVLWCTGTVTVTDGGAGYAKGCLYIKTDVSTGTSGLYKNDGTTSSCDFNLIEGAEAALSGLTANPGLLGTATEGTATVSLGLQVRNETGGTLVKGTLVRPSGYANSRILIVAADADTAATGATYVLDADLLTATNGDAYAVQVVTGINTDAVSAIGDPLYLDATTAGAFTATAPSGADQVVQKVGIVIVKHASTGSALFFPGLVGRQKVGTSGIQNAAISAEHLDAGILPTQIVIGSGIFTTAGGDANESITVTGCVGTDSAIVWVQKAGATPRTVDTITPGTGSVAVVLSDDPSTDHKLGFLVVRTVA